jgi:hypothetical protein
MQKNTHSINCIHAIRNLVLVAFLFGPAVGCAAEANQKAFPTPNAAMVALVAAIKSHATDQVFTILGPELAGFIDTRDKSQNEIDRVVFLDDSRTLKLEKQENDPNTLIAYLGQDEWPFPAPLVKTAAGWKFDSMAGLLEIQNRQIGRNELAAISASQAYVDAQLEYHSSDRQGDGYLQFAQRVNSNPEKFDGLYWSTANGEDVSPIGPFAAQAAATEANYSGEVVPHSGYYLKILTAQGAAATGGARSYLVDGRMIAGFGLVAWPADYKVSGVSTFIVNQLGVVYQKDLGPGTITIAHDLTEFNPDSTWTKVE